MGGGLYYIIKIIKSALSPFPNLEMQHDDKES